jgi:hypothetical protein
MPTNQPDPKQPPTTFDDTEAHMGRFIAPVEEPETEAHSAEGSAHDESETEAHTRQRGPVEEPETEAHARHAPAEEPQS